MRIRKCDSMSKKEAKNRQCSRGRASSLPLFSSDVIVEQMGHEYTTQNTHTPARVRTRTYNHKEYFVIWFIFLPAIVRIYGGVQRALTSEQRHPLLLSVRSWLWQFNGISIGLLYWHCHRPFGRHDDFCVRMDRHNSRVLIPKKVIWVESQR